MNAQQFHLQQCHVAHTGAVGGPAGHVGVVQQQPCCHPSDAFGAYSATASTASLTPPTDQHHLHPGGAAGAHSDPLNQLCMDQLMVLDVSVDSEAEDPLDQPVDLSALDTISLDFPLNANCDIPYTFKGDQENNSSGQAQQPPSFSHHPNVISQQQEASSSSSTVHHLESSSSSSRSSSSSCRSASSLTPLMSCESGDQAAKSNNNGGGGGGKSQSSSWDCGGGAAVKTDLVMDVDARVTSRGVDEGASSSSSFESAFTSSSSSSSSARKMVVHFNVQQTSLGVSAGPHHVFNANGDVGIYSSPILPSQNSAAKDRTPPFSRATAVVSSASGGSQGTKRPAGIITTSSTAASATTTKESKSTSIRSRNCCEGAENINQSSNSRRRNFPPKSPRKTEGGGDINRLIRGLNPIYPEDRRDLRSGSWFRCQLCQGVMETHRLFEHAKQAHSLMDMASAASKCIAPVEHNNNNQPQLHPHHQNAFLFNPPQPQHQNEWVVSRGSFPPSQQQQAEESDEVLMRMHQSGGGGQNEYEDSDLSDVVDEKFIDSLMRSMPTVKEEPVSTMPKSTPSVVSTPPTLQPLTTRTKMPPPAPPPPPPQAQPPPQQPSSVTDASMPLLQRSNIGKGIKKSSNGINRSSNANQSSNHSSSSSNNNNNKTPQFRWRRRKRRSKVRFVIVPKMKYIVFILNCFVGPISRDESLFVANRRRRRDSAFGPNSRMSVVRFKGETLPSYAAL